MESEKPMLDAKSLVLLREIVAKTHDGRMEWEPTASASLFLSAIESYSLHVSKQEQGPAGPYVRVVLKDEDGRMLLSFDSDEVDKQHGQLMNELYESARRKALRVDQAVDSILSMLKKL